LRIILGATDERKTKEEMGNTKKVYTRLRLDLAQGTIDLETSRNMHNNTVIA
jgi:hypothetical protein